MEKVLLIPDSFKGTMSSIEICTIMEERIRNYAPKIDIVSIPVADGGEGSVDTFLTAVGGEKIVLTVKGPFMENMESFYGLIDDGKTAIIEMAACAGLPLVEGNLKPELTTTYGVGQMMADAVARGCSKIIVGLGGSATNDFGTGAASALGIRFYDKKGNDFIPTGGTLSDVTRIDKTNMTSLAGVEVIAMCDVDTPLYGKMGAAYVFAPQKGADLKMVKFLDDQLRKISIAIQTELGVNVSALPGAGAAGGMGGGMVAFFNAQLQMGIETVLDAVHFDQLLLNTDLILTGEGKLDSQSLRGKVVVGVARRAKKKRVPVVALVGDIDDGIETIYDEGISAIFSINRLAIPYEQAKLRSHRDLYLTMDNLMRFMKLSLFSECEKSRS